jgi:hypothetical protein
MREKKGIETKKRKKRRKGGNERVRGQEERGGREEILVHKGEKRSGGVGRETKD